MAEYIDPQLAKLKADYSIKLITVSGYIVGAIQILELTEIDLKWFAELLGIPYKTLTNALIRLRKDGLVTIPNASKKIK
jgi:DNA-binding GntR family transcriptional regulator